MKLMLAAVAGVFLVLVPAALADSSTVLRLGSHGAAVGRWQQILNEWVGASGSRYARAFRIADGRVAVDGRFGPETKAATRALERESRIRVTGADDARTRLAWIGGNVTCCGAGYPRLSLGDTSGAVGWWQIALDRWLARHHRRQLLADGVFGPATRAATNAFRSAVHLSPTGVADEPAWHAMVVRNLAHLP
jgi:peptidoglycan hydrolase-like protein with peptidoglycan-binding domain